jgi:DNA-binding NarL/FixJ family response regulator
VADHTIAIVDDHPLFRDALRESLKTALASLETVVAGSLEELNALLGEDRDIDLVLLDLNMPGVRGFSGFVPKSQPVEQIRTAVQAVLAGDIWTPPEIDISDVNNSADEELIARLAKLTPQQVRVLMMLAEGLLNKQIAYELGVSEATIKAHVSAILQKLGVDSRTQAVIAMNRVGTQELQGVVDR